MSDKNEVEFRVRVTDDGLAPLVTKLDKVDQATDDLGKSAATTGKQLDGIGKTADPALDTVYRRGRKAAEGIDSISLQLQRVQNALIALGVGDSFLTMIKGAADTADNYNNLAARIQLATGAGALFEESMQAVEQIALDTNSSLEGTGDLFARLTDAGKSAGLGTQEAVSQALSLTESINQAVQVSGAGAQASDAALRQLIQGLQGGALRGDEFNSVMEQSPRLAKALADGLGVTTGQLRTMANEGRLTSDVVIQSLKSQADTLKSEFETLPPTVGRAVQNLSTAWTVYVGNADKATGASKTAAEAINVLAENLDTIAGYLIDAGQAAAAFAALRLAQTFIGIGAAATTSATAIAANTAAMTAANAASAGAAAGVGRFADILGGLKTFTLLGLVTNFKDIGTWIGEGIAKLQGYKDGTEELERAERSRLAVADEQRKVVEQQAAAVKAAAERQFDLSAAAKSSIAAFDDLVKGGKSASDAVAEIGKDFDLSTSPGIVNAAAVLDKLAADGKISAEQFSAAWGAALKGQDLQAFEVQARAALAGTAREGERLAAIMDSTLREAIRRSGGDFDVLSGGMSKAARSAINDLDTIINGMGKLKTQGVDVGKALELSLNQAIKTADSQAAIDALRVRLEQLRTVSGAGVADGLLRQLEEQAKKATSAVGGLDSALKKLGVTSDTDLKKAATETRGLYEEVVKAGGSAREQSAAFERMAAAAVASGDAGALAFVRSQAAARGFEVTTDSAGKTTVKAMNDAAKATSDAGRAADGAAGSYRGMAQSAEQAAAAAKRLAEVNRRYSRPGEGSADPKDPGRGSPYARPQDKAPVNSDGQTQAEYQRAQRLAGQNAVDNTLMFELEAKLRAGTLTDADAADMQAVIDALDQNDQIDRDVDRMSPGLFSLDGMRDRNKWRAVRQQLASKLNTFGDGSGAGVGGTGSGDASASRVGGTGSATGSTTHNVNISIGGRTRTVNTASAQDAQALAAVLKDLEAAAGRTA